jgi:hypothetical protein
MEIQWQNSLRNDKVLQFQLSVNSVDRLCGLVVRVPGYRSRGPGALPDFLRSSGSGTGSTQPREDK